MDTGSGEKRHRRSHYKSRLGCRRCKNRKIKCDETKPICINCTRRGVACSYPTAQALTRGLETPVQKQGLAPLAGRDYAHRRGWRFIPSSYNSKDFLPTSNHQREGLPTTSKTPMLQLQTSLERHTIQQPRMFTPLPALSYHDVELLHHYYTVLVPGSKHDDIGPHFWRDYLPKLAHQHHHLMHLMLAFSAIHKARLLPQNYRDLKIQATHHQNVSLHKTADLINGINSFNFEAVSVSAGLLAFYILALGPKKGEYIGFSDQGKPQFVTLMRGIRSIMQFRMESLSPDVPPSPERSVRNCGSIRPNPNHGVDYMPHFRILRTFISEGIGHENSFSKIVYMNALHELERFYFAAYGHPDHVRSTVPDAETMGPFGWLYGLSNEFLDCLQHKTPHALSLFACFTALLRDLETSWIIRGWPVHIMAAIYHYMSPEHRDLLRWPMDRIGMQIGIQN